MRITSLNLPDFRSSERTFQLLAQVAGRAGRAEKEGRSDSDLQSTALRHQELAQSRL